MNVRSVDEVNISNWTDLGATTAVQRRSFDLEVRWTNLDGTPGTHSSSRTFPGALSAMPLAVLRKHVEQMILEIVRVELGLNTWDDFLL